MIMVYDLHAVRNWLFQALTVEYLPPALQALYPSTETAFLQTSVQPAGGVILYEQQHGSRSVSIPHLVLLAARGLGGRWGTYIDAAV
ncbi:hypothetical protein PG988_006355 [Apiospora saccharicola]